VWTARDDDATMFAILRATTADSTASIDDRGHIERDVRRSIAADIVRLDARATRLTIATARPSLVRTYARPIGESAHGDATAFFGRAAVTLKKVQSLGAAGIAAIRHAAPIVSAKMIAALHFDGKGARRISHGHGAHRAIEADVRRGGYLAAATIRFTFEDGRDVDGYVELPNRISVADPRYEHPVRAGLGLLGVFDPGAIADDIATLAPWRHPEPRWRDVLGDEAFARAVKARLFTRVVTKRSGARVALPGEGWLGARVRAFPLTSAIDRGKHYAIAEDPSVAPRTVEAPALASYALDATRLADRFRTALGLRAPSSSETIALPKGFVDAGIADLRGAPGIRFVRLVRAVGDDERTALAAKVRRACGGRQHAVLLVPEGRSLGNVIPEIALGVAEQFGVGEYEGVVIRAARELRVEDALPARYIATRERPLVIVEDTPEAYLGSVHLDVTENQHRLFLALARAGRIVHVKDLGQLIAPAAGHVDKVVRKTRGDLDARVAASFAKANVKLPDAWKTLVEHVGRLGYRLTVGATIV
jgi:hypothetical protein